MLRIIHNISILFVFLLMLAGTASAGDKQLLIAVAGESTETTSSVSKVAAREPYFLLFDGQNNFVKAVENPAADASGGAGPSAAAFLAEQKVNLVIAGQFGNKMAAALKSSQIKTVQRQGLVIDAVKEQNHAQ